jgi:hypothetical protein
MSTTRANAPKTVAKAAALTKGISDPLDKVKVGV